MRHGLAAFVALAVVGLAPAPARADEEGEDVLAPLPWHVDADTLFLRRIVSMATGEPVAGATVRLFCEVPHPEPGFGMPAAEGTSGADGWVRIHKADVNRKVSDVYGEPTWAYVEAHGFGLDAVMDEFTFHRSRGGSPEWWLRPRTTLRCRLVDPLDRPVAGAFVGWLLGCGHTPDVIEARTGADGVAVIDGVQAPGGFGQGWPVAEGLRSPLSYLTHSCWAPWQRPITTRLDWSLTIEGTVLTHDGKPATGIPVGRAHCHRGPWTLTDPSGRFRLIGSELDVGETFEVVVGEYAVTPAGAPESAVTLEVPAPPRGFPAIVHLPKPGTRPDDSAPSVRVAAEVEFADGFRLKEDPPVEVVAVRRSDGWTTRAWVGEQRVALLSVVPGEYAVLALGRSGRSGVVWSHADASVVAPDAGGAYVRLSLPAPIVQPLKIEWPESPSFDEVALVAEGEKTILSNDDKQDVDVLIPKDRDVFLRVSQGGRTRLQPIPRPTLEVSRSAPPIRVTPWKKVDVIARFEDPDGQPARGWLVESDDVVSASPQSSEPAATTARVATLVGEGLTFVAKPEDETRWRPIVIDVPRAPVEDGKPVDLGAIRFRARAPALRLEGDADEQPSAVWLTNDEHAAAAETGAAIGEFVAPSDAPGLLSDGAIVRARFPDDDSGVVRRPFHRRLEGPGPWTLRLPNGELAVAAYDEHGAPLLRWTLWLDGERVDSGSATLRLTQVEAGPHEAVVESEGLLPRRLRFSLADGGQKRWTCRLRKEPPPK